MRTADRSKTSWRSWSIVPPATGSANALSRRNRPNSKCWPSCTRSTTSKCASSTLRPTIPTTAGTLLFDTLQKALSDTPPERVGAAILITDGVVHDIPAPNALGFNAPVHGLITGHQGERDRRVELLEAPKFGIVGKDVAIKARVLDTNDDGTPVELTVKRDGLPVTTLNPHVGETVTIDAPVDHPGDNVYEIEVTPLPGELTELNNRVVATISGVRDKLRVLLVSGEPHPGERMWRNVLKADGNVDLVHFTILRSPDRPVDAPINELSLIAFPVADIFGRRIKDFDLIIFDRYSRQSVVPTQYLDNIVDYVKGGGALLIEAGPEFLTADGLANSPLAEITPGTPNGEEYDGPFKAQISALGQKHPVTRALLNDGSSAWGSWFRAIGASATSGDTIMDDGRNHPLLTLAHEDKGRVGLILTDQMWLWARGFEGGGPHLELLRRIAHWLMKEPELEEEFLSAKARGHTIDVVQAIAEGRRRDAPCHGPRRQNHHRLHDAAARKRRLPPEPARRARRPDADYGRRTYCARQRRRGQRARNAGSGFDARSSAPARRRDGRRRDAARL